MWEWRLPFGAISKGLWKEWEACFWLSMLSTAPAFPLLSLRPFFVARRPSLSFALGLVLSLLILLRVLHAVARDV
jgi:hypothetical protein